MWFLRNPTLFLALSGTINIGSKTNIVLSPFGHD